MEVILGGDEFFDKLSEKLWVEVAESEVVKNLSQQIPEIRGHSQTTRSQQHKIKKIMIFFRS